MKMMKIVCFTVLWILIGSINNICGQSIAVINVSGDSYVEVTEGEKVNFKKIVFGPLPETKNIHVKENSSLKLLNDKKEICSLTTPGVYKIENLKFSESNNDSASLFSKFCDYFHSFFVNHSSSESKANYKNSIYAISRGANTPAQLDFPMEGMIPIDAGPITFSWSHACKECQYIVSLNDLNTKANVYAWTTNETSVTLVEPTKFLEEGKDYYWSVSISGQNIASENIILTTSSQGEYSKMVMSLEKDLDVLGLDQIEAKTVYVMSEMSDRDLTNFGLVYGFKQYESNNENQYLINLIERFWYDNL